VGAVDEPKEGRRTGKGEGFLPAVRVGSGKSGEIGGAGKWVLTEIIYYYEGHLP